MFVKIYVKMYTKIRLRHQSLGHRPDRVQENMSRPHHPKKLNSNYHGPYIKVPVCFAVSCGLESDCLELLSVQP